MTMNILIIGDRPQDEGLKLLRSVTKDRWTNARIVTLETAKDRSRSSLSKRTIDLSKVLLTDLGKIGSDHYSFDGTPVDLVDLAHLRQDLFLPPNASWDFLLTGIATDTALGLDVLTAGHTCAAMWAATAYKLTAIAVAQEGPGIPSHCAAVVNDFLRDTSSPLNTDLAWNLTIPQVSPLGYKSVNAAYYSPTRLPPTSVVPRAREEQSDVTLQKQGYVTLTQLDLRTNKPLRF